MRRPSSSEFKWLQLLHYLAHLQELFTPGVEDTTQKVAGGEPWISEDPWIIGVGISFLLATD